MSGLKDRLSRYHSGDIIYCQFISPGKIYVTLDDGKCWRWGGSAYVEVAAGGSGGGDAAAVANWAVYSADDYSMTFLHLDSAPVAGETTIRNQAGTADIVVTGAYPAEDSGNGWAEKAYSAMGAVPWDALRASITTIEFRDPMPELPDCLTDGTFYGQMACWFTSCSTAVVAGDVPAGLTSIGRDCFSGCSRLALTALPESVTRICTSAFRSCGRLALTSLPNGITNIETYAFSNCTNLALTSLPWTLLEIGDHAFESCSALAIRTLPAGIHAINSYAFSYCGNIRGLLLPDSVSSIGDCAFQSSSAYITSLPDSLSSIGGNAFYGNRISSQFTHVPAGVKSIGSYAFGYNSHRTRLQFDGTPSSIASAAFAGWTRLADIYVPWSEGEVANAPWGATNATIHYDYHNVTSDELATSTADGLMSSADKGKLDGLGHTLTLTVGSQSVTFDGTADQSLTIATADGVSY